MLSGGVGTSFRFLSRGSRRAVVLIHGNLSSFLIWEDLVPRIPEDFDVVAPDLRGFSGSGRASVDATKGLGDFSADLLELLQGLRYDSYVLVGHSMGGWCSASDATGGPTRGWGGEGGAGGPRIPLRIWWY